MSSEFLRGFAEALAAMSRVTGVPEIVQLAMAEHEVTIADLKAAGAAANDLTEITTALGRLPKS